MVGGLILVAGCDKPNNDPVVTAINATPGDNTPLGGTINLSVVASDPDNDPLTFTWSAAGGSLSSNTGSDVVWTAPGAAGTYAVSVTASDGREGTSSMDKALTAYKVWSAGDMQGFTPESTYLSANTVTYVPFTLEDQMPDGAVIDSLLVSTDLEPDGEYEYFQIWLVTPGGNEVMVYDGLNGEPDVDDLVIQGVKGTAAKGDWKLKVSRGASGTQRWAEECAIDVYYRY
jgi:hypothetical protein